MWKIIKIFLQLSVMYKDFSTVEEFLHKKIVTAGEILTEDEFNGIHSIGKISLVSYKLTYAFSIGKKVIGTWFGFLLMGITLIPSLVLYSILLYILLNRIDDTYVMYICLAIAPVMAAYFISNGFFLIQRGYSNFPLFTFGMLCIIGFVLVFILQWPIALVVLGSLFFFLCFMKGGNING